MYIVSTRILPTLMTHSSHQNDESHSEAPTKSRREIIAPKTCRLQIPTQGKAAQENGKRSFVLETHTAVSTCLFAQPTNRLSKGSAVHSQSLRARKVPEALIGSILNLA